MKRKAGHILGCFFLFNSHWRAFVCISERVLMYPLIIPFWCSTYSVSKEQHTTKPSHRLNTHSCTHTHPHKQASTHTQLNINMHTHANIETQSHIKAQTPARAHTRTHILLRAHTHTLNVTHKQSHTLTFRNTISHTVTHTERYTNSHRHKVASTDTQTHTNLETQSHIEHTRKHKAHLWNHRGDVLFDFRNLTDEFTECSVMFTQRHVGIKLCIVWYEHVHARNSSPCVH